MVLVSYHAWVEILPRLECKGGTLLASGRESDRVVVVYVSVKDKVSQRHVESRWLLNKELWESRVYPIAGEQL